MGNTGATPVDSAKASPAADSGDANGVPQASPFKWLRNFCSTKALTLTYIILCALVVLVSLIMIAVTVGSAIALRVFSADHQSGRLVALLLLSVMSAIALSMAIYALIAVLKKHSKPVYAASIVMIILAVLQGLLITISIPVSSTDQLQITSSLSDSFRQAREDPRQGKSWANIQSELNCCGVLGPDDYRFIRTQQYFIPNIPISCCPSYDPNRVEIVQEREREMCRMKREFYLTGCNATVLDLYNNTAIMISWNTILHILLLLFHSLFGALIVRNKKIKVKSQRTEVAPTPEPQVVVNQKPKAKLSMTS